MLLATRPVFAYLRALAEGVLAPTAAARYLGVEDPNHYKAAHRKAVDEARTAARRHGDPAWRLLGIEVDPGHGPTGLTASLPPPLDIWAAEEGVEDWNEREQLELYTQRFGAGQAGQGADPAAAEQAARYQSRTARLRERRLALLRELERIADSPARVDDKLAGWFDDVTAERLGAAGAATLGDLQLWISQGRRWWADIPALGDSKARSITAKVTRLVGSASWAIDWPRVSSLGADDGKSGANRQVQLPPLIEAGSDAEAVSAWLEARSNSPATTIAYRREVDRFLLWCLNERSKSLSDVRVEDCRAYMVFLADVPTAWISRDKVAPFTKGWAPFAGKLSTASQGRAVVVLASLFGWLAAANYLQSNPWALINRKIPDDRSSPSWRSPTTKAFTPEAWKALKDELERAPLEREKRDPFPLSRARLRWLCTLCESTGLRAAELIAARREHVHVTRGGALLEVIGKGSRAREVPLPKVAMQATRDYFIARGLDFDTAPPATPLLGSLVEQSQPLTYSSLYETFTRFVKRAVEHSSLGEDQQRAAIKASLHWLRHTHATRFAERGGDLDVLQANLGHSDPRTSARYYPTQIERRQAQVEKVFGDGG